MIYFVRSIATGLIKIGHSSDVQRRMPELLREHGPMELLSVLYGSAQTERAHHVHFAALNAHGEWFTPGAQLLSYIASLPSQEPPGPVRPMGLGRRRTLSDVRSREWPHRSPMSRPPILFPVPIRVSR